MQGSVLAYGLVIMFMISIILTSIIGFVASQTKYALQVHAKEQAFQIAETGIHFYRWYLAHQVEGRTAQQVADFWENPTRWNTLIQEETQWGGTVSR